MDHPSWTQWLAGLNPEVREDVLDLAGLDRQIRDAAGPELRALIDGPADQRFGRILR